MTVVAQSVTKEKVKPALRNRLQWLVVSYDITDDKRRTKVMKTLNGYGQRIQYSVFECEVRPAQVRELQQRIRALIRPEEDSVRFYLLCEMCLGKVLTLGVTGLYRRRDSVLV